MLVQAGIVDGARHLISDDREQHAVQFIKRIAGLALDSKHTKQLVLNQEWNTDLILRFFQTGKFGGLLRPAAAFRLHALTYIGLIGELGLDIAHAHHAAY